MLRLALSESLQRDFVSSEIRQFCASGKGAFDSRADMK
jgi:hypothetical protein